MRNALLLLTATGMILVHTVVFGSPPGDEPKAAPSQGLLTMATKCDEAQKKLTELIAKPESKASAEIEKALGVYIFASCKLPDGKVICFQCLDDNQQLRTLQLFRDATTMRFEFKGYGCRCRDQQ